MSSSNAGWPPPISLLRSALAESPVDYPGLWLHTQDRPFFARVGALCVPRGTSHRVEFVWGGERNEPDKPEQRNQTKTPNHPKHKQKTNNHRNNQIRLMSALVLKEQKVQQTQDRPRVLPEGPDQHWRDRCMWTATCGRTGTPP